MFPLYRWQRWGLEKATVIKQSGCSRAAPALRTEPCFLLKEKEENDIVPFGEALVVIIMKYSQQDDNKEENKWVCCLGRAET